MRRPKQHDTDEAAKRVFNSLLPTDWVAREISPDYGLDYRVEIFDQGERTGLFFSVQLKGREHLQFNADGTISQKVETANLRDYLKDQDAVFLVVVDTSNEKAYWRFMQKCILEKLNKNTSWHKQKSKSIRLSADNLLDDTKAFREQVDKATTYVRRMHPVAAQEAIRQEEEKWKSVDPRIDVRITASRSSKHYSFFVKEPLELRITNQGDTETFHTKLRSAVDFGHKVTFKEGEATIEGSPVFEEISKQGFSIQSSSVVDGHLRVTSPSWDPVFVPVKITAGKKQANLEASLPQSPFSLSTSFSLVEPAAGGKFNVKFRMQEWFGKSLRRLPYFDDISHLVEGFERQKDVNIECLVHGNRIWLASLKESERSSLSVIVRAVSLLKKSRDIARRFDFDLDVPDDLGQHYESDVNELYGLVTSGEYCFPTPSAQLSFKIPKQDAAKMMESEPISDLRIDTRLGFDILGYKFDLDDSTIVLTRMAISRRGDLSRRIRQNRRDLVTVVLEGCANTTTIYSTSAL